MAVDQDREVRIARARAVKIEDELKRRGITLKKIARNEFAGPCPVCGGDDRFSINTAKQVFHCRGCQKGGDIIELVTFIDGGDFNVSLDTLAPDDARARRPAKSNGHAQAKPNGGASAAKKSDDARRDQKPAAVYDYVDESGALLFQVLRYHFHRPDGDLVLEKTGKPKKTFRQRMPDPDEPSLWIWGTTAGEYLRRGPGHDWWGFTQEKWDKLSTTRERKTIAADVASVPYQLPDLIEAISLNRTIYIPEGEQKVDALMEMGLAATTNCGGAGKWTREHAAHLRDANVVILPDADKTGREHAEAVALSLDGIATRIRVVELPGLKAKQDIIDWIAAGGTREQLEVLVEQTMIKAKPEITGPVEFDLNKEKTPKVSCANARAAIKGLGIDCRYDEFHDKLLVGGHAIAQYAGELSDHACLVLRRMITEQFGFDPGRNHTFDAAVQLCLANSFDPIRQYLNGLKWDGTRRLDNWLSTYVGAEDNKLNRAIGRLSLVALVRRARQPGCKFDQIIVWESPEGTLKSTALAVLAGDPANFSDQTILGLADQAQQERLRGKWVYEISDLSGIRKAEVEQVKAFASRTHDRARPAYGRCLVEMPRRCVIFGTTNEDTYLKSRTGNRRFWPVATGKIDIDALRHDRDQLFAEAAAIEATGVPLVLPASLWSDARSAQDDRLEHDPWIDTLASLQGTIYPAADGRSEEERIASDDTLTTKLGIPAERQTDTVVKRLAFVMRKLGWKPVRARFGNIIRRGYCRPLSAAD